MTTGEVCVNALKHVGFEVTFFSFDGTVFLFLFIIIERLLRREIWLWMTALEAILGTFLSTRLTTHSPSGIQ